MSVSQCGSIGNGQRMQRIGSSRVLANSMNATNLDWCIYGHAAGGNTGALRALWARGTYLANPSFGGIAAAGDHLETLEWLLEHGVAFDALVLASNAAAGGATMVQQWIWDKVNWEGCDLAMLRDLLGAV
jgi:ABC-type sugar transport system substrate-binding protein